MSLNKSNLAKYLILLILIYFAFIIIPNGPGISYDSITFLQAGNNFFSSLHYVRSGPENLVFAGETFPIYTVLATIFNQATWTGLLLQICLFGLSLYYYSKIIIANNSSVFHLLLFTSISLFLCYYNVWTESLYGLLFLMLLYNLTKPQNKKIFVSICILITLLCLTRMVGIVIGGTFFLSLLIHKQLKLALAVIIVTVFSFSVWLGLGVFFLGETARAIAFHPPTLSTMLEFPLSLGGFIIPRQFSEIIPLIIGSILLILPLLHLIRLKINQHQLTLIELFLILHFYGYILFLTLSITFIDISTPIESRTLIPLFINLLVLFLYVFKRENLSFKIERILNISFVFVLIASVCLNIIPSLDLRKNGFGYSAKFWNDFDFPDFLKTLSSNTVYVNDKSAVLYFTDFEIQPKILPEKFNVTSLVENQSYLQEYESLIDTLVNNKAAYIIWISNGVFNNFPSYDELKSDPNLKVEYDDGVCLVLSGKRD